MFKSIIRNLIQSKFMTRITKALIRNAIIHEKSEKYRRDVKNAIQSYEFEKAEFQNVKQFEKWEDLMFESIKHVSPDMTVWIEGGVMTGTSIRAMARYAKKLNLKPEIHGFDSFEGLPEDWHARAKKGAFAIKQPKFKEKNIKLHVGLFEDTMPKFTKNNNSQIGFLHVDSDLYSSAKCTFENFNIGKGTVILFDEYWNYPEFREHEIKAFKEFIQKTGLSFRYIGYNKNHMQASVIIE